MARIAILGSRGLPIEGLSFGGFEAFLSGLAPRLVQRGHEVTYYCRKDLYPVFPAEHDGVKMRYISSIEHKALGTPLHMTLCAIDAIGKGYDAALVVNSGNGLQCGILRLFTRARLALNMDGVEWERGKWGPVARWYFKFASKWGARFVHVPIADSLEIRRLYENEFGIPTTFIPYAADPRTDESSDKIRALGLVPGEYALIVGRLIPENCTDAVVEGFQKANIGRTLVVVGGSNYDSPFHAKLRSLENDQTKFLGHVHDQELLWQLFKHSWMYLHGHSVGGTNPALLQALACSCLIAANDVVFNREVAGDAGTFFEPTTEGVAQVVRALTDAPEGERARLRERALARLHEGGYTWDHVTREYARVLGVLKE